MGDFIEVPAIIYINKNTLQVEKIKYTLTQKKVKNGFSKAENTIWNWLKYNNIDFEFQKRFLNCRDKNTLPFDFYIPKYNLCIEYQGSQHYDPGFYIRKKKSQEEGMQKYLLQKKHDEMKKDYCKQNNINFLEIKYTENIEKKLQEALL